MKSIGISTWILSFILIKSIVYNNKERSFSSFVDATLYYSLNFHKYHRQGYNRCAFMDVMDGVGDSSTMNGDNNNDEDEEYEHGFYRPSIFDMKSNPLKKSRNRSRSKRGNNLQRKSSRKSDDEGTASVEKIIEDEEHPLRTDEWILKYHLPLFCRIWSNIFFTMNKNRELHPSSLLSLNQHYVHAPARREQTLKFHPNGFVLLVESHHHNDYNKNYINQPNTENNDKNNIVRPERRKTKVGKWDIYQGVLTWEIPVRLSINDHEWGNDTKKDKATTRPLVQVQYSADLHLNKFGKAPRMFRGIITRDR